MTLFLYLLALYAACQGMRVFSAIRYLEQKDAPSGNSADVTLLQPILSGDPNLERTLTDTQNTLGDAACILLIDHDDLEAQRIAAALHHPATRVLLCAPPQQGENPKVIKLAAGLLLAQTPYFAVLDDDTVLPEGALGQAAGQLSRGDLVTGLPLYTRGTNPWSALVAAFVNGSALITYPTAAALHQQRTLNGMFYLGRKADLAALGGFDAIRETLTDDYAMARLYLDAGKTLVQSRIVHPISTEVRDAGHYANLMRRWMIFARRYLAQNQSPFTMILIGCPVLLAPVLLIMGAMTNVAALLLAVSALMTKSIALAVMRYRYAETKPDLRDLLLEPIADMLTPAHLLHALLRPNRFQWRSRSIAMKGDDIRYK